MPPRRRVELLTGAVRLSSPRWTHDGAALVVSGVLDATHAGLYVVPRLGGTPRRLADAPLAFDTHPAGDSVALVQHDDSGPVLRMLALRSGDFVGLPIGLPIGPADLAWSPDGRTLATADRDGVSVIRRDDGSWTVAHIRPRVSQDRPLVRGREVPVELQVERRQ